MHSGHNSSSNESFYKTLPKMHVGHWRQIVGLTWGRFSPARAVTSGWKTGCPNLPALLTPSPWRGLRTSLPVSVWVNMLLSKGPTWRVPGRSPFGGTNLCSLSSMCPRPTKPLAATCCTPHRCKKHSLHDSVWGWNESKWFGKAARGVWSQVGPVLWGKGVLG